MPTTPSDLDSLAALFTLLRAHGVVAFIGHGVEVRLGDLPAAAPAAIPAASTTAHTLGRDPDLCACGHSVSIGHNPDGECITGGGCDAGVCAGDAHREPR